MEIDTKTVNDILKRIKAYCEGNYDCEDCPFRTFEEETSPGMSPLNSFCEFGFESLHPMLPYQWPIEDLLQNDEDVGSEDESEEEDDTILPW